MLEPEQFDCLARESERTGLSRSELVRRALDAVYRPKRRKRVKGFDVGVGVWRDPDAALIGRRAGRG